MKDLQFERKIEKYRAWADYISKLRYSIISRAIPKTITFTANGGVKYEYSQEIEDALEEINKMKRSVFKEII